MENAKSSIVETNSSGKVPLSGALLSLFASEQEAIDAAAVANGVALELPASVFSKYIGARPLHETSIDDIPVAEQRMFWSARSEDGDVSEDEMALLYSAWHRAQVGFLAIEGSNTQRAHGSSHDLYNTTNFPTFVFNHGNWDIFKNDQGKCACIPTISAAANGCKATHFGDMEYLKVTLPAEYAAWKEQQ